MKVRKITFDGEEYIGTVVTSPNNTHDWRSLRYRIDVNDSYLWVCEYREDPHHGCVFENGTDDFENIYNLTYEDFLLSHMTNRWNCSMRDLGLYYTLYEFCVGRLTQEEVDVKVNEILEE